MSTFKRRTISRGQTVASKLKAARLKKNLSLTEVAEQTKIQIKYLTTLEEGDYQKLPGDVYTRVWIKLYAKFLDLPVAELLQDYKLEKTVKAKTIPTKQIRRIDWHNLLRPRVLKIFVVVLIIAAFLGYLAWEINDILAAPKVFISQPVNNLKTTANTITVVGQTEAEVQLRINNEIVLLDEQGNFSQDVSLSPGLNNLQINAKKKHSRTNYLEWVVLREGVE